MRACVCVCVCACSISHDEIYVIKNPLPQYKKAASFSNGASATQSKDRHTHTCVGPLTDDINFPSEFYPTSDDTPIWLHITQLMT